MKVAYADPPYPGMAAKHYKNHPDYAGEVDHAALLRQLTAEYEHWALSTSSSALVYLVRLPECPKDVRIAAWVKPFCAWKRNVNPAYAWEPVLFSGGRKRPNWRTDPTIRDWVSAPMETLRGTAGAKPEAFCFWLFALMGMQPGDELVDLFPGSGAVTRAWEKWQRQLFGPRFPDGSPDLGICPLCDGSGLWKSRMCQTCKGTGRSQEEQLEALA